MVDPPEAGPSKRRRVSPEEGEERAQQGYEMFGAELLARLDRITEAVERLAAGVEENAAAQRDLTGATRRSWRGFEQILQEVWFFGAPGFSDSEASEAGSDVAASPAEYQAEAAELREEASNIVPTPEGETDQGNEAQVEGEVEPMAEDQVGSVQELAGPEAEGPADPMVQG